MQEGKSKMDIIYVAYNSEKWVEKCFTSLLRSDYDLKDINVYVVDNASTDHTVERLQQVKEKLQDQLGVTSVPLRAPEDLRCHFSGMSLEQRCRFCHKTGNL